MKKNLRLCFSLLSFLLMGGGMHAQNAHKPFDVDLWQGGMPNTNGRDSAPFDDTVVLHIIMKVTIGHLILISKVSL